jgi:hypothetical protein
MDDGEGRGMADLLEVSPGRNAAAGNFSRKGAVLADRKSTTGGIQRSPTEDSQAVARYLADMTGQLETMARAAKLELLAYLLAMARAEAENVTHDGPPESKPR